MREYKAGRRRTKKEPSTKPPDDGRPLIRIVNGELPRVVDEAEGALILGRASIYQRAGMIVRPATLSDLASTGQINAAKIVQVRENHLAEEFTRYARWERFDHRANDWCAIDAPVKIAATFLERAGKWQLRHLSGIISAPTLRPNGTILDTPGYDALTGLLFDPSGVVFPTIPDRPTYAQAIAALGDLEMLIQSFDFDGGKGRCISRSVALSAILTACIRGAIKTAPLHAFTAPVAGSGKSKLVDLASIVATGRAASVMSLGRNDEEMEKRLAGVLLGGDQIVNLDNIDRVLGGDLMAQILTQQSLKIRPLGRSDTVDMPSRAFWCCTGNNLAIGGDLARRTLICKLDPHCERPEQRRFDRDPIRVAHHNRERLVAAALIVLRAFHVAGRPSENIVPLGSFEEWSALVRNALIWLGEPDPVLSMEAARDADPALQALASICEQWWGLIGDKRITATEIIAIATMRSYQTNEFSNAEFREALLIVAGEKGNISGRRLGGWLSKIKDRISHGFALKSAGQRGGVAVWQLGKAGAQ